MMRLKTVQALAAVLVLALTCAGSAFVAQRATAQAVPPVAWRATFWGTELVAPEPSKSGVKTLNFYLAPDGDLVVLVSYVPAEPTQGREVYAFLSVSTGGVLREFRFGNEPPMETGRRVEEFAQQSGLRGVDGTTTDLQLPNGYVVRAEGGGNCSKNYAGTHFSLRGAAGIPLAAKALIQLLDEPFPFEFSRDCEDVAKNRTTDMVRVHGRDFLTRMIDLGDGTWLLSDANIEYRSPPTLIRFRGFLESPYLAARPDLLIVDAAELYPLFIRSYLDAYAREGSDRVPIEYADEVVYEHFKDRRGR